MGFLRQEYWNGLPLPSPGALPDPGIRPKSPTLQADSLLSEPPGEALHMCIYMYVCLCVYIYMNVFAHGASQVDQTVESACNVGDLGSTPGLGRSPGGGKGRPLQYSWVNVNMCAHVCLCIYVYVYACVCVYLHTNVALSWHIVDA